MLIIGRKRDQKIIISDNIEITVLEIGRNRVRFGIQAPKEVPIHTRLQELPEDAEPGVHAQTDRDVTRAKPGTVRPFKVVAGSHRRSG